MIRYGLYDCPLGTLVIGYEEDRVVSVKLASEPELTHCPSPVADLAAGQLRDYLAGRRKAFDFPIRPEGTPFQMAVWKVLQQIPYGQTSSYGQIAVMLGKPTAARAVGQAANRNPLWIVIPCHRVVGKGAELTGYAGGIALKQALLELERNHT